MWSRSKWTQLCYNEVEYHKVLQAAASAKAVRFRAVMVQTFCCSSARLWAIQVTIFCREAWCNPSLWQSIEQFEYQCDTPAMNFWCRKLPWGREVVKGYQWQMQQQRGSMRGSMRWMIKTIARRQQNPVTVSMPVDADPYRLEYLIRWLDTIRHCSFSQGHKTEGCHGPLNFQLLICESMGNMRQQDFADEEAWHNPSLWQSVEQFKYQCDVAVVTFCCGKEGK